MKIAVCDDLIDSLEDTKKALEQIPYVEKIDLFSNIEFLFDEIRESNYYDAVLMDIDWEMDKTGLDFAAELQKCSPATKVIYVTAYTMDYVEDVFLKSSNLSGFLMKPIKLDSLKRNLEKVLKMQNEDTGNLVVKHKGTVQVIPFQDILYLESRLHKAKIITESKIIECGERLDQLGENLNEQFLRCHQSYIVNMNQIQELQRKEIILKNGVVIPISKKRYMDTKTKFFEYLSRGML